MRCKFVALHLELTGGCALLTALATTSSAVSTATVFTPATVPASHTAWRSASVHNLYPRPIWPPLWGQISGEAGTSGLAAKPYSPRSGENFF